jgi:hypothetical protein
MVACTGSAWGPGAVAMIWPTFTVSPALTLGSAASPMYCLSGKVTCWGRGISIGVSPVVVKAFGYMIPLVNKPMVSLVWGFGNPPMSCIYKSLKGRQVNAGKKFAPSYIMERIFVKYILPKKVFDYWLN